VEAAVVPVAAGVPVVEGVPAAAEAAMTTRVTRVNLASPAGNGPLRFSLKG